jgi:hypothetical protein
MLRSHEVAERFMIIVKLNHMTILTGALATTSESLFYDANNS